MRISSARLTDVYLRPDGQYVDGHMALELSCVSVGSVEVRRVDSIELDEENGFDLSQYPAVTLVRAGDETMWELAKEYHSSVERSAPRTRPRMPAAQDFCLYQNACKKLLVIARAM